MSSSIFGQRSVQVAPRRSVGGSKLMVKQEVHPIFCFFLDVNVEREFQLYYRREKQVTLPFYMVTMIGLSILMGTGAGGESTADLSASFAAAVEPTTSKRSTSQRVQWMNASISTVLYIVFPILALGCAYILRRCGAKIFWVDIRVDPVQLVLVLFYQLVIIPVVITMGASIELQLTYIDEFDTLSALHALHREVLVILGISFVDCLYFFLLLASCTASCILRMQFVYFLVLGIESAIVVTAVSIVYFPFIHERWSLFVVFLVVLAIVARAVWDHEQSCRREFLSSSNLLNENRRLSNQNIEMKEELSGKLNYQLHYEMGDILRILCQIKVKMSAHEKKDIDKIITALITNNDLFEVSLDPSMTEHEEEVQGWLHMMAFKETPPTLMRGQSRMISQKAIAKKPTMLQSQMLKTAHSRKLSRNIQTEMKAVEVINTFFNHAIAEDRDEFSRWLFDTIRNEFFVDLFYIEQYCASPLQAVLITCVEINDFVSRLALDMKKLTAFAGAVENHYFKRNPYHNCLHAAAVVADIHFYLRRLNLNIDDSTFFVGLIAAAAHDISHPGVSNGFLIATRSKLAITYSDDSVLERMHIAELYRILSHEKFDIFSHMNTTVRAEIRKLMIQMILATDLSRHFPHISKLKSRKFAVNEESRGLDVTLIMETLLMLADLGHTAKPFAYHQLWADRIAEEFFRQGEAEERQNLPISPLCDRKQANLPKSQVTFLTLLATPLFQTAGEAFAIEEYDVVMKELQTNIRMWQGMIGRSESNDGLSIRSMRSGRESAPIPEEPSQVHHHGANSPRGGVIRTAAPTAATPTPTTTPVITMVTTPARDRTRSVSGSSTTEKRTPIEPVPE